MEHMVHVEQSDYPSTSGVILLACFSSPFEYFPWYECYIISYAYVICVYCMYDQVCWARAIVFCIYAAVYIYKYCCVPVCEIAMLAFLYTLTLLIHIGTYGFTSCTSGCCSNRCTAVIKPIHQPIYLRISSCIRVESYHAYHVWKHNVSAFCTVKTGKKSAKRDLICLCETMFGKLCNLLQFVHWCAPKVLYYCYLLLLFISETELKYWHIQRNLSWETTAITDHLSWTYSWQKVPHFSANEPVAKDQLSWETIFYGQWGGLSRQILLYNVEKQSSPVALLDTALCTAVCISSNSLFSTQAWMKCIALKRFISCSRSFWGHVAHLQNFKIQKLSKTLLLLQLWSCVFSVQPKKKKKKKLTHSGIWVTDTCMYVLNFNISSIGIVWYWRIV